MGGRPVFRRPSADHPALWREDLYFHEQNKYTANRAVTETITAGYAMASGRLGRTGVIAGVRTEKTDTSSWGWVRTRTGSTVAQQTADPVGSADPRLRRHAAPPQRRLHEVLPQRPPHARPHLQSQSPPQLVHQLRPPRAEQRPAQRNHLRGQPNPHCQQPRPPPAKRRHVGRHARVLLRARRQSLRRLVQQNHHRLHRHRHQRRHHRHRHRQRLQRRILRLHPPHVLERRHRQSHRLGVQLPTAVHVSPRPAEGLRRLRQLHAHQHERRFRRHHLAQHQRSPRLHPAHRQRHPLLALPEIQHAHPLQFHRQLHHRVHRRHARPQSLPFQIRDDQRRHLLPSPPSLQLTLDAGNLTNEPQSFYRGIPAQMQNTILNGTTLTFGINGRF
jgi:hypothetical protein